MAHLVNKEKGIYRAVEGKMTNKMKNILSIDTESWIHFYEDALKIKKFTSAERKRLDRGYVKKAIQSLLTLLERYNQKATFFIVAEIYEWYPEAIEEIRKRGHEIAYHTHTHPLLKNADILERELFLSREFIRKFRPRGFRAPQIYLTEDAMPLLERYGFTYSSSSYDEYIIEKHGSIKEIPVSTMPLKKSAFSKNLPKQLSLKMLFSKIPIGSGLFVALFGPMTSRFITKINRSGSPAILFIHPWQLYQTQEIMSPRFRLNLFLKNPLCLPYTINVTRTMEKIFKAHKFTSFRDYFDG